MKPIAVAVFACALWACSKKEPAPAVTGPEPLASSAASTTAASVPTVVATAATVVPTAVASLPAPLSEIDRAVLRGMGADAMVAGGDFCNDCEYDARCQRVVKKQRAFPPVDPKTGNMTVRHFSAPEFMCCAPIVSVQGSAAAKKCDALEIQYGIGWGVAQHFR